MIMCSEHFQIYVEIACPPKKKEDATDMCLVPKILEAKGGLKARTLFDGGQERRRERATDLSALE